MTTKKTIIISILIILLISCSRQPFKDKPNHPDWKILNLPNGWTLATPVNFKESLGRGVDSNPGYIYSTIDSIFLEFDSGTEFVHKEDCNFEKQIEDAKQSLFLNIFKEQTGFNHTLSVDTIGSRIALVIIPTIIGKGYTYISIKDCSTDAWLGVQGSNLDEIQQKVVLNIFETIGTQNDKK